MWRNIRRSAGDGSTEVVAAAPPPVALSAVLPYVKPMHLVALGAVVVEKTIAMMVMVENGSDCGPSPELSL